MSKGLAAALLAALLPPVSVAADEKDATAVLQQALDGYIRPAYLQLEKAASELSGSLDALCSTFGQRQLEHAKGSFKKTALAWSKVEWFRAGPVVSQNRVERMLYYPDRKGIGRRQVHAALDNRDESVLQIDTLQRKSVAMQGLSALEHLLFGRDSAEIASPDGGFRCQFAMAAASNVQNISSTLRSQWREEGELASRWTRPSDDNPYFHTDREAMSLLLGTLIHGLEAVRDVRIGYFLRDRPTRDRPKAAVLARSGSTLESITANLEGLELLFKASGIEQILPPEEAHLGDSVRFEFRQAIDVTRTLQGPVDALVKDPEQRTQLQYLQQTVSFVIERLDKGFAPAAGLAAGFSFGDGD